MIKLITFSDGGKVYSLIIIKIGMVRNKTDFFIRKFHKIRFGKNEKNRNIDFGINVFLPFQVRVSQHPIRATAKINNNNRTISASVEMT